MSIFRKGGEQESSFHLNPKLLGIGVAALEVASMAVGALGVAEYTQPYADFDANRKVAASAYEDQLATLTAAGGLIPQQIPIDTTVPWEIVVGGDSWPAGYNENHPWDLDPFTDQIQDHNDFYLQYDITIKNTSKAGATTDDMVKQLPFLLQGGSNKVVIGSAGGIDVMTEISKEFPSDESFSRLINDESRDDVAKLNRAVDAGAATHRTGTETFLEKALDDPSVKGLILTQLPGNIGDLTDTLDVDKWTLDSNKTEPIDISSKNNAKALINIIAYKINEATAEAVDDYHEKHPENTIPIILLGLNTFTKEDVYGIHPTSMGDAKIASGVEELLYNEPNGMTLGKEVTLARSRLQSSSSSPFNTFFKMPTLPLPNSQPSP